MDNHGYRSTVEALSIVNRERVRAASIAGVREQTFARFEPMCGLCHSAAAQIERKVWNLEILPRDDLSAECAAHLRQDARGDLLILENSEVISR